MNKLIEKLKKAKENDRMMLASLAIIIVGAVVYRGYWNPIIATGLAIGFTFGVVCPKVKFDSTKSELYYLCGFIIVGMALSFLLQR